MHQIFVVTKVLHYPRGKPYTTFVFLNTVFLISGLVHVGGEYMMLGKLDLGAFRFLLLQGFAISVETIVQCNVLSLSRSSLVSPKSSTSNTKIVDADHWVCLGAPVVLVVPAFHGGSGYSGGYLWRVDV